MPSDKASFMEAAAGNSGLSTPTPPPRRLRLGAWLQGEINAKDATYQLIWACFLTGFTSSVTFTACYIWCGFQTGGTIQLGLALARLFSGPEALRTIRFEYPDRQALVSLLSFIIGTSIGRVGDRIGPKKRVWLVTATMAQAFCLMAGALTAWKSGESGLASSRGEPSWITPLGLSALGFASASLGIQGIIGKRLATEFATCVVLTTIWVEIINDPKLFARTHVKSRDHKASAIFMLFLGGILGRALIDTIGSAGMLGIAAGCRVLAAVWWIFTT